MHAKPLLFGLQAEVYLCAKNNTRITGRGESGMTRTRTMPLRRLLPRGPTGTLLLPVSDHYHSARMTNTPASKSAFFPGDWRAASTIRTDTICTMIIVLVEGVRSTTTTTGIGLLPRGQDDQRTMWASAIVVLGRTRIITRGGADY